LTREFGQSICSLALFPTLSSKRALKLAFAFYREAHFFMAFELLQLTLLFEPLRRGERMLHSGVGELKAAWIDLQSRPAKQSLA
jgi:hypothetical protein